MIKDKQPILSKSKQPILSMRVHRGTDGMYRVQYTHRTANGGITLKTELHPDLMTMLAGVKGKIQHHSVEPYDD